MPTKLLRGIERIEHLLADGIGADALDKLFGHVVADVGLEQGLPDQLQPFAHVRFRQLPFAAQAAQGVGQTVLDGFEHRFVSVKLSLSVNHEGQHNRQFRHCYCRRRNLVFDNKAPNSTAFLPSLPLGPIVWWQS